MSTLSRIPLLSRHRVDLVAVFALAFVIRLVRLLTSSGGLGGDLGYDPSVYYAGAASLLRGQLPYGDFILLHPPGVLLALAPFAGLGRVTSDHLGFEVATVAFVVLAAVNAALVTAIGRRCGLDRRAALLGGLFYAVWFGAITAEVSARLEPLGSFTVLLGLFLLTGRSTSRRVTVGAGAALGVGVAVKIWWLVPPLLVLAWLFRTQRHRAVPFGVGVLAGVTVVCAPFFAAAPGAMWRMVVSDQLGRQRSGGGVRTRIDSLTSLQALDLPVSGLGVVALVVLALLSVRAWRVPFGRVVVVVLWTQIAVLLTAPAYYNFYAGYLAASAAVVVACAARSTGTNRPPALAAGAVVAAAAISAFALVTGVGRVSAPFPAGRLAAQVDGVHCLMTDSPMALIALDALDRNLAHHCENWVDVSGRTYDLAAPRTGHYVHRRDNVVWQADILRYLRSGDAVVLIRPATGLSRATMRVIRSWPVLARAVGVIVHRVPG